MRRNAIRWLGAAAALLTCGAGAVIAMTPRPPALPLHFWTLRGENPPRVYAAPGSQPVAEHADCTVVGELPDYRADVVERDGRIRRVLVQLGLLRPPSRVRARSVDRQWPRTQWIEFLGSEGTWPDGVEADAALVGHWIRWPATPQSMGFNDSWDLAHGGRLDVHTDRCRSGPAPDRWGRVGDLLLFGWWNPATSAIDLRGVCVLHSDDETEPSYVSGRRIRKVR